MTGKGKRFKLQVPLMGASDNIKDLATARTVKVIARDSEGFLHSQTVEFDAKRLCLATFTFPKNPGPLHVYVVAASDTN